MTNKTHHHYSSIGKMLSDHNFEAACAYLKENLNNSELMMELKAIKENTIHSEIDDILFATPDFVTKKTKRHAEQCDYYSGDLYPMALEFVKLLLEIGADPLKPYKEGQNALLKFSRIDSFELISALLSSPKTFKIELEDIQDGEGKNCLHYAIKHDAKTCLDYLMKNTMLDINKKVFFLYNQTPVFYACQEGAEDCLEILIKNGANFLVHDLKGRTPLDTIQLGYNKFLIHELGLSDEDQKFWQRIYSKVEQVTATQKNTHSTKQEGKSYRTKF